MNSFNDEQLEQALRGAPAPRPPRGLKERLIEQARPTPVQPSQNSVLRPREGWLRKWWPALASLGASLACAVVITIQQGQIRELKQTLQAPATDTAPAGPIADSKAIDTVSSSSSSAKQQEDEIAQLTDQVAKLSAEISQIEHVQAENKTLRTQLATPPPSRSLSPDEVAALEQAKARALRIQCINNMKQMALAVKIWAGDNNDIYPSDIVSMSNELSTTKILVCPADTNRPTAANFGSYNDANCSYEFLAVRGSDTEPTRVLFRCPIHGNIALCDGAVISSTNNAGPKGIVQRDGKLYYEPPER